MAHEGALGYAWSQPQSPVVPTRSVRELSSVGEIMSLTDAKLHLGITDTRHDSQITQLISEARDYCERYVDRTFRTTVLRQLLMNKWPHDHIDLYSPPLKAITSITYFDADDVAMLLPASEYNWTMPDHAHGRVTWNGTFTRPSLSDRTDAVVVQYESGYSTVPPSAVSACKLVMDWMWDNDESPAVMKVYHERADAILDGLCWGDYS